MPIMKIDACAINAACEAINLWYGRLDQIFDSFTSILSSTICDWSITVDLFLLADYLGLSCSRLVDVPPNL